MYLFVPIWLLWVLGIIAGIVAIIAIAATTIILYNNWQINQFRRWWWYR